VTQPQSGTRLQPTAQAVGKGVEKEEAPEGRKKGSLALGREMNLESAQRP
jgi:hypothetical protein